MINNAQKNALKGLLKKPKAGPIQEDDPRWNPRTMGNKRGTSGWKVAQHGPHKGHMYQEITDASGQTVHRYKSGKIIKIPKTFGTFDSTG